MDVVVAAAHALHATRAELPGYPDRYLEVPQRAEMIEAALRDAGWCAFHPAGDYGLAPILAVHDAALVEFLQQAAARSESLPHQMLLPTGYFAARGALHRPAALLHQAGYHAIDPDAPILPGTWRAAYGSAQAALSAAAHVVEGSRAAYALCRPPGHHVTRSQYGGYCYLNNAAIAAAWLRQRAGRRVAIIDVDYHHGNGAQEIFYRDPTVLTCSLHADPDQEYPYFWGSCAEQGADAGLGANRNWPLSAGTDDAAYLAALDEALAVVRAFAPGYLVIAAGFDGLVGDPSPTTGGFRLSHEGFSRIGERLAALALPTVIVQEGGYQLDQVGKCARRFLQPFAGL